MQISLILILVFSLSLKLSLLFFFFQDTCFLCLHRISYGNANPLTTTKRFFFFFYILPNFQEWSVEEWAKTHVCLSVCWLVGWLLKVCINNNTTTTAMTTMTAAMIMTTKNKTPQTRKNHSFEILIFHENENQITIAHKHTKCTR